MRQLLLRRGALTVMVLALMPISTVAVAADGDTTTTTIEIEISATSIVPGTPSTVGPAAGPATDDTLPFTGPSHRRLAWAAAVAAGSGLALVGLSSRTASRR